MRTDPQLGAMMNPGDGKSAETLSGIPFAIDNGAFAGFDEKKWRRALLRYQPVKDDCLFAVVPDVVADHEATLEMWFRYRHVVEDAGYPVAFVAQDGWNSYDTPWDQFDCLFIGGSTEWKLSEDAARAVHEAKLRSLWAHVGRVNSGKRLRWATSIGADSCDGTFVAFGPDINLPKIERWLDQGVFDLRASLEGFGGLVDA